MFVNLNDYSFSVPQNPRSLEQILSKYLESLNRQAGNLPFCSVRFFHSQNRDSLIQTQYRTRLETRVDDFNNKAR